MTVEAPLVGPARFRVSRLARAASLVLFAAAGLQAVLMGFTLASSLGGDEPAIRGAPGDLVFLLVFSAMSLVFLLSYFQAGVSVGAEKVVVVPFALVSRAAERQLVVRFETRALPRSGTATGRTIVAVLASGDVLRTPLIEPRAGSSERSVVDRLNEALRSFEQNGELGVAQ